MEEILENLGFEEIESAVYQMGMKKFSVKELWMSLLQGDFTALWELMKSMILENTVGEWKQNQGLFQEFLLIMVFAALVGYLYVIYEQSTITRIVECMLSLLLTMLGLIPLYRGAGILKSGLEVLFGISKVLAPLLLATMTIAVTGVYALGFSQMMTIFLFGIQYVMLSVLCPICGYLTVFSFMDCLWLEKRLKDFIKGGYRLIDFGCKGAIYVVSGSYFVKNQILSLSGQMKKENLQHLTGLIPGLGKLTEGGLSLLYGSTALIFKTTGGFAMGIVVLVCLPAFMKLGCLTLTMYVLQCLANLLLSSCMGEGLVLFREIHLLEALRAITEGLFFMLKLLGYCICFFLLLVALAAFGFQSSF